MHEGIEDLEWCICYIIIINLSKNNLNNFEFILNQNYWLIFNYYKLIKLIVYKPIMNILSIFNI